MSQEMEAIYKQMAGWQNIIGYIVLANDGVPIKTTLNFADTIKYAGHIPILIDRTRKMVQGIVMDEKENTDDDVMFLRFHAESGVEVLVAPQEDYYLVVVQCTKERTTEGYVHGEE